jgi:hypothetical protein
MTDLDFDPGPALRERVADVHPDLERLARTSLRAGTRIRRRRTIGISVAAAAGVAAVAGAGWQMLPGSSSTAKEWAGAPAPAPEQVTITDRVGEVESLRCVLTETATPPAVALPPAPEDGTSQGDVRLLATDCSPVGSPVQELPVTVPDLPGWTFEAPGDNKFGASKGEELMTVYVRPVEKRPEWTGGDADKVAAWVSPAFDNYFVTIEPNPGVAQATVDELAAALQFEPSFADWQ